MYDVIMKEAIACATAFVDAPRIDEINILQATYEAMTEAVSRLCERLAARNGGGTVPAVLLIDAVHVPRLEHFLQVSIVKGDAQSASIAAASIVAKVERDRLMREYDKAYPVYGFAQHKGYGTKAHIAALRQHGPCPLHRKTFIAGLMEKA